MAGGTAGEDQEQRKEVSHITHQFKDRLRRLFWHSTMDLFILTVKMMDPRIVQSQERLLAGMRRRMSFSKNATVALWQTFMPRRQELQSRVGNEYYSLEVYDDAAHFKNFDPSREFSKWAAVEVSGATPLPEGMETLRVPAGKYAVFPYKGSEQDAQKAYRYIFTEWLPASGYTLDHRPHFALMGEKYRRNDPASEEEIWIPVK
jgi:AraC family transcriptional regulator